MKRETKARIKSAALALMMVVASVPMNTYTGHAATDKPVISFVEGDPYTGYVVTGRSITVNEQVPNGLVSAGLTLTPSTTAGTATGGEVEKKHGVTIGERTTSGRRSIVVDGKFKPDAAPQLPFGSVAEAEKTPLKQLYVVNGMYNALSMSGIFNQSYTMGDPADPTKKKTLNGSGTATFDVNVAVTRYSRMILKAESDEMTGSLPSFSIDYDAATPEGVFAEIVGTTKAQGEDLKVRVTAEQGTNARNLTIRITNVNNQNISINLVRSINYPAVTHTEQDPDGKDVTVVDKPAGYEIRENTQFELIYQMPTVEPRFLTIMTPQAAVQDVEQLIRDSDGKDKEADSFISLSEGDSLDYISDVFDLRHLSTNFNAPFRVEWSWQATDILDAATGTWKKIANPNSAEYKNVVQIGGSNQEWQTVTLNALEDDVKGQLSAKVFYQRDDGTFYESCSDTIDGQSIPTKTITVRGTGKPVSVTGVKKITGTRQNSTGKEETINEKLTPGSTHIINMDAYRGGIKEYNKDPEGPFQYELEMNMGMKNGAAPHVTVEMTGDTDAVTLKARDTGGFKEYSPGAQIKNPVFGLNGNTTAGITGLQISARQLPPDTPPKSVTLTIKFAAQGPNNTVVDNPEVYIIKINVKDNTPSQDSSLKSLVIQDQDGDTIPFSNFSPDTLSYTGANTIHIPFKANSITITPTLNDPRGANNPMRFYLKDTMGNVVPIPGHDLESGIGYRVQNGQKSFLIPFYKEGESPNKTEMLGKVYSLFVVAPSQDPRSDFWTTYQLDIVRDPPSTDNTLGSLGIYLEDADPNDAKNNLIQNFDPKQEVYEIWIPYSTKMLRVRANKNDSQAKMDEMKVTDLPDYKLEGITAADRNLEWLKDVKGHFKLLPVKPSDPTLEAGVMELTFTVTSEEGWVNEEGGQKTYRVRIHREDPKDDAFMSAFEVTDSDENVLTYTPSFSPDTKTYTLEIPYSVRQIKFNVTSNDPNVSEVELWQTNTKNGDKLLWLTSNDASTALKLGVLSKAIDVQDMTSDYVKNNNGYHPFYIKIIPESEKAQFIQEYLLRVRRAEPSTDAKLKDLLLKDQDNADIKTFGFHPDETEYHLTVPYKTTGVSFTPTTNHQYAKVELSYDILTGLFPYEIESGATSKIIALENEPLKEKEFKVKVTAEDGKTVITYHVFIQREKPSDDARLKALKTENTENFKPLFISSKTDYSADVKQGAPGVIIIPTANHPGATIRVDGVVVESGQPTDLIELLEIKQTVKIEVIAEDGVTRKVYKIEFTNQNLIEKTSNADLRRLAVNYGLMTPNFQSAVTDYEVTAKEKTWSVDIVPRLADQYATMRVLNGTRELGDYDGNYALALVDGENKVTIEVTSPDKTVTKNYDLTIYRNEEEKLKNLEPLEAEDINFEQVGNPIIVKIEEYPRVGASVFNTIREEYPDRSIIFQGNDYSIRFDGKNLTRVIPQTEIYDFRMTFDSPDEEAIYDLIGSRSANDDIIDSAVLLYFDYHGSLPGPATFNLSLGRRYANDTLYWHYYNQERDRIDYYGSLQSNTKGNIAVSIDHFSTYIVTPEHRIAGSEDKAGIIDEMGMVSNGQDLLGSGGKLNPDTGVEETP